MCSDKSATRYGALERHYVGDVVETSWLNDPL